MTNSFLNSNENTAEGVDGNTASKEADEPEFEMKDHKQLFFPRFNDI